MTVRNARSLIPRNKHAVSLYCFDLVAVCMPEHYRSQGSCSGISRPETARARRWPSMNRMFYAFHVREIALDANFS